MDLYREWYAGYAWHLWMGVMNGWTGGKCQCLDFGVVLVSLMGWLEVEGGWKEGGKWKEGYGIWNMVRRVEEGRE